MLPNGDWPTHKSAEKKASFALDCSAIVHFPVHEVLSQINLNVSTWHLLNSIFWVSSHFLWLKLMGSIFAGQTTSSGPLTRVAKAVSKAVSSGALGLHGPYHFWFKIRMFFFIKTYSKPKTDRVIPWLMYINMCYEGCCSYASSWRS